MYAGGPGFFIFFHETEISAGSGQITYRLSEKTVLRVAKKVRKYIQAKREVNPENINAIVEAMVDSWPKAEVDEFIYDYNLPESRAISTYREALLSFFDDDLALILILASA